MDFHVYRPKFIDSSKFIGSSVSVVYSFEKSEGSISFGFKLISMFDSSKIYSDRVVTINKNDYSGGLYSITSSRTGDKLGIHISPKYTKREVSKPFMWDDDVCNLVRFYITDDLQNMYIYLYYNDTSTDTLGNLPIESVDLGVNYSVDELFFSKCSEIHEKMTKWNAKIDLQNKVNDYNSISYLEGQLDVLYKIVEKLIEKTGTDVSEYKELLDSVDSNSVLTLKDIKVVTGDILDDKSNVRKAQTEYYKVLKGLSEGTGKV